MFDGDFLHENDCILHSLIANIWCSMFMLCLIFCECLRRLELFDWDYFYCVCILFFYQYIYLNSTFCVRMQIVSWCTVTSRTRIFCSSLTSFFSWLFKTIFRYLHCCLCFFALLDVSPHTLCEMIFLPFWCRCFGLDKSYAFAPYSRSRFVSFCQWTW